MIPLQSYVLDEGQEGLQQMIFATRSLYHSLLNPDNTPGYNYPPGYGSISKFTRLIQEERHRRNPPAAPPPVKKEKDKVCYLAYIPHTLSHTSARRGRLALVPARELKSSRSVTTRWLPSVKPSLKLPPVLTRYFFISTTARVAYRHF